MNVCEVCKSKTAELIIARRKNGILTRLFVCEKCLRGALEQAAPCNYDLRNLYKRHVSSAGYTDYLSRCSVCGTREEDIATTKHPGCCDCYYTFEAELASVIEAVQHSRYHVGKTVLR